MCFTDIDGPVDTKLIYGTIAVEEKDKLGREGKVWGTSFINLLEDADSMEFKNSKIISFLSLSFFFFLLIIDLWVYYALTCVAFVDPRTS